MKSVHSFFPFSTANSPIKVLLEHMGLDATSVFEDMHNGRAMLVLLKYVIGRVKVGDGRTIAAAGHSFVGSRRNSRIRHSTVSAILLIRNNARMK